MELDQNQSPISFTNKSHVFKREELSTNNENLFEFGKHEIEFSKQLSDSQLQTQRTGTTRHSSILSKPSLLNRFLGTLHLGIQ